MDLEEKDLAYIAGFFDGEGCIYSNGGCFKIGIYNTVRAPLDFVERLFGGNIYEQVPKNIRHSTIYRWIISGESAAGVLQYLMPYLIIKKKRAILGIKIANTSNKQERFSLALELKRMNCRGRTAIAW